MVDPFMLNTDNMTRVEAFNMFLPRRARYRIEDRKAWSTPGLKTKMLFNEYLLFNDSEELCLRRIRESIGHQVLNRKVESAEVVPVQADRKAVLTNVSKETLKTQRKSNNQEVLPPKVMDPKKDP